MKTGNKFDDVTLAMSLPENQREPILRALEYERNPTEENCRYVCEVMKSLLEIKSCLKERTEIQKRIDDVIKFAIRKNADRDEVKRYFEVKSPLHKYKISDPVKLLSRLMQIFDDPMEFATCIEFNYKNLKDLMGEEFIAENSDIITETEYSPPVYMKFIY